VFSCCPVRFIPGDTGHSTACKVGCALSCMSTAGAKTSQAQNERECPILFHHNGFSTVSATLMAPGSRLRGCGPQRTHQGQCVYTHRAGRSVRIRYLPVWPVQGLQHTALSSCPCVPLTSTRGGQAYRCILMPVSCPKRARSAARTR
jgi:hypothetical protein